MKPSALGLILLLTAFLPSHLWAEQQVQDAFDAKRMLVELLDELELSQVTKLDAVTLIDEMPDADWEAIFENIPDKELLVSALDTAKLISKSTATAYSDTAAPNIITSALREPVYPQSKDFEFVSSIPYELTDSIQDRCDASKLNEWVRLADALGDPLLGPNCGIQFVAGNGVFNCFAASTVNELAKRNFLDVIEACGRHDRNVNRAELTAAHKNSVDMLNGVGSLAADLANLELELISLTTNLASHAGDLREHDSNFKALLEQFMANQETILELLNTPPGLRDSTAN